MPAAADPLARCDASATMGYCREYPEQGWSMETAAADCEFTGIGIFGHSGCPRMNGLALCRLEVTASDGRSELVVREIYYKPAFTLKDAEERCSGELLLGDD